MFTAARIIPEGVDDYAANYDPWEGMNRSIFVVGFDPTSRVFARRDIEEQVEKIKLADVVLYDELASDELLHLAPDRAERINVGKRGHDAPTRGQQN